MKLRIVLYCLLGGLPLTFAAMGAGHFPWWWSSGIVLAAAFVPLALFGPRSVPGQLAAIIPVLAIVTVLCTWSEALIFTPQYREHALQNLIAPLVMYLIVAIVLAVLPRILKLTKRSDEQPPRPSPLNAFAGIAVCGIAYVIFYLIFGGITYQYFTHQYYPEAAQVAGALGVWFWVIQFGRGVLMTLAVVPAIYTLRMTRWQTAIAIAMLLWVAGGLSPLLVPNPYLGTAQKIIHTIEIFTQLAPLGIVTGLLLRPKPLIQVALPKVAAASL